MQVRLEQLLPTLERALGGKGVASRLVFLAAAIAQCVNDPPPCWHFWQVASGPISTIDAVMVEVNAILAGSAEPTCDFDVMADDWALCLLRPKGDDSLTVLVVLLDPFEIWDTEWIIALSAAPTDRLFVKTSGLPEGVLDLAVLVDGLASGRPRKSKAAERVFGPIVSGWRWPPGG